MENGMCPPQSTLVSGHVCVLVKPPAQWMWGQCTRQDTDLRLIFVVSPDFETWPLHVMWEVLRDSPPALCSVASLQNKGRHRYQKWVPKNCLGAGQCQNKCQPQTSIQVQFSSVAQLCPTLCDPMNHSMPGLPVHHQLPESTQTHVHRVGNTIQVKCY